MQSERKTSRHGTRTVQGFTGLRTNVEDSRSISPGAQFIARNIMYDSRGNARPRDGYSQWWAARGQRTYLAEMEPSEDAEWTNGAASVAQVRFGAQSRLMAHGGAGTITPDRALGGPLDLTIGNAAFDLAQMQLKFWFRVSVPANISAATLRIETGAGAYREFDFLAAVTGAAANTWTLVSVTMASGADTGAFDETNINTIRFSTTATGVVDVYVDEAYIEHQDFSKSYCLGFHDFKQLLSSKTYLLGTFGDTVFADLNEAQAPEKIWTQPSRNLPTTYETTEDRTFIFNGVDPNVMFTGDTARPMGYPIPLTDPTLTPAAAGGSMADGEYHYGITFVYGELGRQHGQSTMKEKAGGTTIVAGGGNGQVTLTVVPTGTVGAGVIARRIWRSRAGAGPNATKYFITELADNTTTTFIDTLSDADIILGAAGPIDNGLPPVAKYAIQFERGMLLGQRDRIFHSRPGVNLDETPETFPASAIVPLPNAGVMTGFFEFAGNCYVMQTHGMGKVIWRGNSLQYRPIQRTKFEGGQAVGAADQAAITIVGNQYAVFKDSFGQCWKMLPNEEIFKISRFVTNLLDDFNDTAVLGSFDYHVKDTEAEWAAGTLEVTSNLSTSRETGNLVYEWDHNLVGGGGTINQGFGASATFQSSIGGTNNNFADIEHVFKVTAIRPGKITSLKALVAFRGPRVDGSPPVVGQPYNFTISINKYKPEAGDIGKGALLATIAGAQISVDSVVWQGLTVPGAGIIGGAIADVFVPIGEQVVITVSVDAGGPNNVAQLGLPAGTGGNTWGAGAPFWMSGGTQNINAGGPSVFQDVAWPIEIDYEDAIVTTNVTTGSNNTVQRYGSVIDGSNDEVTLNGSGSATIDLEAGEDGVVFPFAKRLMQRVFLADNFPSFQPIVTDITEFFPLRDHRVGEPYPADPQQDFFRVTVTIDPNRPSPVPATEADSRVSLVLTDSFATITAGWNVGYSAEFPYPIAPYDPVDFINDIYTSEIVNAGVLGSWGKWSIEFEENQHILEFQVRTATSSGGIAAAVYATVLPNTVPPVSTIVANATHFQWRVIFKDDLALEASDGAPSRISKLNIAWSTTLAGAAPNMPPNLLFFKDHIHGSWTSRGAVVADQTICITAHDQSFNPQVSHSFSDWGGIHFAATIAAGSKFLVGPAVGGKVLRGRNSDIADDAPAEVYGPTARFEFLPMNYGSAFIKSLHSMYLGLDLNYHANGQVLQPLSQYPDVTVLIKPFFFWYVASSHSTRANLDMAIAGATSYNSYNYFSAGNKLAAQAFKEIFSHSSLAAFTFPGGLGIENSFVPPPPNTRPFQTEYYQPIGLQERAFVMGIHMFAFKDTLGNSVFPTFSSLGADFFTERYRGV